MAEIKNKSSIAAADLKPVPTSAKPGSPVIRGYFDAIAFRYDFLNNFLSFKLDELWRAKARKIVSEPHQEAILDLGTGTGKFLAEFAKARKWKRMTGLDFSTGMLQEARKQLAPETELVTGDFHNLPFEKNSFDLIVSAFTLRSVQDMPLFLREVHRLLKSKGTAGFMCLTRPRNIFWKILYYPYLKIYLPLVGGLFTGNKEAYQFLSASIMSFQSPEQTALMMKEAGFENVTTHYFSMGMSTLITGKK